jgi:hypothetical protein
MSMCARGPARSDRSTARGPAAPIGRPRFRITLPSSDVTFSAVIRLRRGVRTIERQVHVPDDGEVTVSYEAELTAIK